jgi:hypothetical protein
VIRLVCLLLAICSGATSLTAAAEEDQQLASLRHVYAEGPSGLLTLEYSTLDRWWQTYAKQLYLDSIGAHPRYGKAIARIPIETLPASDARCKKMSQAFVEAEKIYFCIQTWAIHTGINSWGIAATYLAFNNLDYIGYFESAGAHLVDHAIPAWRASVITGRVPEPVCDGWLMLYAFTEKQDSSECLNFLEANSDAKISGVSQWWKAQIAIEEHDDSQNIVRFMEMDAELSHLMTKFILLHEAGHLLLERHDSAARNASDDEIAADKFAILILLESGYEAAEVFFVVHSLRVNNLLFNQDMSGPMLKRIKAGMKQHARGIRELLSDQRLLVELRSRFGKEGAEEMIDAMKMSLKGRLPEIE